MKNELKRIPCGYIADAIIGEGMEVGSTSPFIQSLERVTLVHMIRFDELNDLSTVGMPSASLVKPNRHCPVELKYLVLVGSLQTTGFLGHSYERRGSQFCIRMPYSEHTCLLLMEAICDLQL